MGKGKDRALIDGAAQHWLNELREYIIPGVLTKEERKTYKRQARKLDKALDREASRAEAKRLRDVDR